MDTNLGDTLAMTNAVRAALGQPMLSELPNATYGDPAACLFYRGLASCGATGVDGTSVKFSSERQAQLVASIWGTRNDGMRVQAPTQMRNIIGRFDSNAFPHYNVNPDDEY